MLEKPEVQSCNFCELQKRISKIVRAGRPVTNFYGQKELVNQNNVYVVAEVKGNTGQHWVAIDYVDGDTIHMMDPGSTSTDMWTQYNWANTSTLGYYKVG